MVTRTGIEDALLQEIEDALLREIDGVTDITFDLSQPEYISSAGLRVLLQMQKTMKTQGSMSIKNVNDDVMEIFKVTGFVRLLHII
ncbi:MAG: STAS domain-containing protein [Ruminiclostridium sp.]|nr:STAS domain-containing protein [Ruminiclostridium sp.]